MTYQLHDVSRFPFVKLRSAECTHGFADAWCAEMDALLADKRPFVVAFEPAQIAEAADDFRARAIWFKANRKSLKGRCAGMVAVIPDAAECAAMTADLAKRSSGLGVPYLAVESFDEAAAKAPKLVGEAAAHAVV